MLPPCLHIFQVRQDKARPCHIDRWQSRGKNQRAHPVHQVIAYHLPAHNIRSHGSHRLAEGTAQEIDVLQATLFLGYPQSSLAPYGNAVRLVYIQHHVGITTLQFHQPVERSYVTVHTEHTFGHHNNPVILAVMLGQQILQLRIVLMTVTDALSRRQADAVNQTRMY